MELRTLKYFNVVAKELNITHAAQKLNMSQPPLSNQIAGLEEELGVQLFIRGKRHLQLTEAGSLLYRRSVQILDMVDRAKQEITALSTGISGTISIGLVEGRPPFLVARWITGFRDEYPSVQYNLWNGSGDDVIDRLRKGLVDIAVVAVPYNSEQYAGFCVGREPWAAFIPAKHPLAQLEGDFIPLSSLKDEPLIIPARKSRIESIRDWFKEIPAEPNILCEMSNYVNAIALSEQGVGISIFPMTTYTPNNFIKTKVITDTERMVEYHLIWNKEHMLSETVSEFINYVRDMDEAARASNPHIAYPENEYQPSEDTKIL
ncbi:MAG: LysR family transcriptional regulator [Oscillospiraceae bacterium]|nr:LysR family transcriptional regulator [Oscillospiraceae bacterium]